MTAAAGAGQIRIGFVSDLAYDQPRVGVYLRSPAGVYLPPGTEGYVMPGLLDTGAAAHVMPKYLSDVMEVPLDPSGSAEILTLCGYSEFLDISHKLYVGVGPMNSEDAGDYVEVGPQRLVVRRVDPPLAELLGFPTIVGTPFLREFSVAVDWQLVEVFPGIELPELVSMPRPAGMPGPAMDLTLPLTPVGETNYDPDLSMPSAHSVPFADVVLWNGMNRQQRQFIVDTGAQISFISTEMALALGVDLAHPVDAGLEVTGAGTCDITIYPYFVDELILPTSEWVSLVYELPMVYVMDVPGIDGGIGSNLLFFFEELDGLDIDLSAWKLGMRLNVPIPPAGDLDGDGLCDVVDLLTLVYSFGTAVGDLGYDARVDVNNDGLIDVVELLQVVYDFGKASS
jgi:hypothetical protein